MADVFLGFCVHVRFHLFLCFQGKKKHLLDCHDSICRFSDMALPTGTYRIREKYQYSYAVRVSLDTAYSACSGMDFCRVSFFKDKKIVTHKCYNCGKEFSSDPFIDQLFIKIRKKLPCMFRELLKKDIEFSRSAYSRFIRMPFKAKEQL